MHWVSKLMDYQKVLNEESMDVSGKQWTCEVFYGRTSNGERVRKIQSKAKPSNSVWDKRYIKRRIKGNPPSIYKVGERVLIWFSFSGRTRGIPKKWSVVDGTIIKRNVRLGKYKITCESPTTQKSCCDWVSAEDITSATAVEEQWKRAEETEECFNIAEGTKSKEGSSSWKIVHPNDARGPWSTVQRSRVSYHIQSTRRRQLPVFSIGHVFQTIGILRSEESLWREISEWKSKQPGWISFWTFRRSALVSIPG